MKYRTIWLIAVAGLMLLACDQTQQSALLQIEKHLPQPVVVPEETLEPVDGQTTDVVTAMKKKQIDTSITPDMLKNVRFDAISDDENSVTNDKPLNLNPAGSTQISVTPRLFFKEELDLKQNYMDNIEGAAVQVELKFD